MANHRISLKPGTEKVGVSASQLLQNLNLKQPQMKCPLCETLVDIPLTLEQDIKDLAQKLGSENAPILFTIHHPPAIPTTVSLHPVTDTERRSQLKEAWKKD